MTVTSDLSTPLDQVRAIIGDPDGSLISDETINALLTVNDNNVPKTAIQCLQYIVADLAKQVHQKVDAVEVWAQEAYEHYKDLLDDLLKDPAMMLAPAVHILGGVSKSQACKVFGNPDSRRINIREGFSTRGSNFSYDPDNPMFLNSPDCGC